MIGFPHELPAKGVAGLAKLLLASARQAEKDPRKLKLRVDVREAQP